MTPGIPDECTGFRNIDSKFDRVTERSSMSELGEFVVGTG